MIDGYKVADSGGDEQSREYGWSVGFGLQQADGLQPSGYAHDVARRQIAGQISYDQAAQEISEYHAANPSQKEHWEADVVSQRISEILQVPTFAFSPGVLKAIHGRLFAGVLPSDWAGVWRTENITKQEPALGGQTVQYSDSMWIEPTLEYDFSEEKKRQGSYQRASREDVAESVFDFLSGVWQIHPFREGNTRTAATFGILYLRFLGFNVDNEPFAKHSQYFRDALALANASDPAFKTTEPLQLFIKALLFDSSVQLKSLCADEPFAC